MSKALGIVFAFLLLGEVTSAFAQSTPEEIRKLLGVPVKIEDAAVFAASNGTFKNLCASPLEFAGIIGMIGRLEFGSLDPPNQEIYKSMMIRQYQGNVDIWKSLAGESAQRDFCHGLEAALNSRAVAFMGLHPSLFETKEAPKAVEKPLFTDAVAQKIQQYSRLRKLYIFRQAENRMADDTNMLMQFPENAKDGFAWALKVSAFKYGLIGQVTEHDFTDIGAVYTERAEIYAKYIRGQIDIDGLKVAENANEIKRNDLYGGYFKTWKDFESTPAQTETAQLNTVANEVGDMIIGQAKFLTAK